MFLAAARRYVAVGECQEAFLGHVGAAQDSLENAAVLQDCIWVLWLHLAAIVII